jgi:hypothetical protein
MSSNTESRKKSQTHRRTKNLIPNNFLCGCGKNYGSKGALNTHIKTKHGDV